MLVRTDSSAAIHRIAACSMHNTHASERQISLQWQGLASSRDDRDVLRLAPRASSWAHKSESWPIHVERDASSSLSKISIRLISDVGTNQAFLLKLEQDQHPAHL